MLEIITSISWHDGLLVAHVLGLIIGFGVAISIDYLLFRALISRRLSPIILDAAVHAARLTAFGLVVLWVSGIGFLIEYNEFSPEKLLNPKVHAKLIIVILLTLNGCLIHRFVMPILWRFTGRDLLALASTKTLLLFCVCAAVSTVSWVFPLVFGLNTALNFSYSAASLLMLYATTISISIVAILCGLLIYRMRSENNKNNRAFA